MFGGIKRKVVIYWMQTKSLQDLFYLSSSPLLIII